MGLVMGESGIVSERVELLMEWNGDCGGGVGGEEVVGGCIRLESWVDGIEGS